ncbi:hypothetical protein CDCA_CDCA04G1267 [Cyanidium caldarium]|uniref:Uncharacterized protein n=1 Tax=Cyanidium caldarium TaxID=2771 RepID=A0AAV9ISC4_CYACA|nr:hypothetical protein CDCA_CDCA04G1267 [Cyanidium caldarium]
MTSLQAYDIAARRRERILANREKRLALASGRSAEVVQEAARRDAAGLSGTLHSGERVRQLMERETPAAHLDRRKRKSSEGLQRASSWREGVLLVAAAALAWLHTRDADPCWRASAAASWCVHDVSAPLVFVTLQLLWWSALLLLSYGQLRQWSRWQWAVNGVGVARYLLQDAGVFLFGYFLCWLLPVPFRG